MSAFHCAGYCTDSTRVLVLKLWKDQKPNMEALQPLRSASKHIPNIRTWGGNGKLLTSGDFGSMDLRPWFELLLSSCDISHPGGPAGIWARPYKAQSCWVTGVFLQSGGATRNICGLVLIMTLILTWTVTHSALSFMTYILLQELWLLFWVLIWQPDFRNNIPKLQNSIWAM